MRLSFTLLFSLALYWQASAIHLKEAISSKLISVEVSGSQYDSMPPSMRSGFAPKMQMTVANLSARPIELDLEPGYMLEATECGYQAMLLTQAVALRLGPHEKQKNYLYAMCTQLSRSGPNSSLHYHVADRAKPSLLQMALFIVSKKYLVHAAQEAVWSISDDLPIPSITDENPRIQDDLQTEAASIKKVNLKEIRKEYEKNKGAPLCVFNGPKIDRNIAFVVTTDSSLVSAAYYDMAGTILRTITPQVLLRHGSHSIRYDPLPFAFAGKRYCVRLIKDGEVYREYNFRQ